jgi:hypothetical protein
MNKALSAALLGLLLPAASVAGDLKKDQEELAARVGHEADGLDRSTRVGGLDEFTAGVDKDLEVLAKGSPAAAEKIAALRAKLKGLGDRVRGKGDRGEVNKCLTDNKEETKRAACETRAIQTEISALKLDPPAASGPAPAENNNGGAEYKPQLAAAASRIQSRLGGVGDNPFGLVDSVATAGPPPAAQPRTLAQTRQDLALMLRASGDRRFSQGDVRAREQAAAVRKFQASRGMKVTGRLDDAMRRTIQAEADARREAGQYVPQRGESSANVKALQEALRRANPKAKLKADGKYGHQTHAALCAALGKTGGDCALDEAAWKKLSETPAAPTPKAFHLDDRKKVPPPLVAPKQAPTLPERLTTGVASALQKLRDFSVNLPQAALDRLAGMIEQRPELTQRKTPDPRLGRNQDLDPYVAVMNADMPGNQKRLAMINLRKLAEHPDNPTDAVTWHLSSDGRGNGRIGGGQRAPSRNDPRSVAYENRNGSNLTPSGLFKVPARTEGTYGGALRLYGQDEANKNSAERGILMHRRFGGDNLWSAGCLRVADAKELIGKLRNGAIYIYRAAVN